jgi:DNA-binding NarL/FixJ family response regulator
LALPDRLNYAGSCMQTSENLLGAKFGERPSTRPSRTPAPKEPPSGKRPGGALTPREREVALLVAEGLTNRRIACERTISERTVITHVDRILRKLG